MSGAASLPPHTTATYTRINFQPDPSIDGPALPSGYLGDYGLAYGDRGSGNYYGWVLRVW